MTVDLNVDLGTVLSGIAAIITAIAAMTIKRKKGE